MKRMYRVGVIVVVDDDDPENPENEENIVAAAIECAKEEFASDSSNIDIEEVTEETI